MANLIILASLTRVAFAQVPLEAQTETLENSLRKSLHQEFPSEPKAPEVIDKTRPTRKAPAAAPTFFIKKIKLRGNSVLSDERLMPQVDLGEGKDVNLNMLNAMADKISAFYASEGYFLARAFIPKQEIKDNTAVITIYEGRINKVIVKGNEKLSKKSVKKRRIEYEFEKQKKEQMQYEKFKLDIKEKVQYYKSFVTKEKSLSIWH